MEKILIYSLLPNTISLESTIDKYLSECTYSSFMDEASLLDAIANESPQVLIIDKETLTHLSSVLLLKIADLVNVFTKLIICGDGYSLNVSPELQKMVSDYLSLPLQGWELKSKLTFIRDALEKEAELANHQSNYDKEREILSTYFSKDLVDKILSGENNSKLRGDYVNASVLVLDIRQFTAISETLEPRQTVEFLNQFFQDVMDIIFRNHGSVNKLLGDAVIATFGCPFHRDDDADNAVRTAVDLKEMIHLFNEFKPDYLQSNLEIGIGVATGKLFAGNIGYFRRIEYCVMGEPLDRASELQTLSKNFSGTIFIDKNTLDALSLSISKSELSKALLKEHLVEYPVYQVEG